MKKRKMSRSGENKKFAELRAWIESLSEFEVVFLESSLTDLTEKYSEMPLVELIDTRIKINFLYVAHLEKAYSKNNKN